MQSKIRAEQSEVILSVSRRTDIPAFYSEWFFEQLKNGFVLVPNPINTKQIQKIKIEPVKVNQNLLGGREISGTVDGIVFWTKNPKPILERIDELKDYKFYFQYTLNPYESEYESGLPPVQDRIETFKSLSKHCPVVWRYDPIFLSKTITVEWHIKQFENMAKQLNGFTNRCMINTLIGKYRDSYCPNIEQLNEMASAFIKIGIQYGIEIQTCAEIINLEQHGIKHGKCVDPEIFEKLLNVKLKTKKFNGATRKGCHCIPCVDIGMYDTCKHGCEYCYARHSGQNKSMSDKIDGEIYERKTELLFDY